MNGTDFIAVPRTGCHVVVAAGKSRDTLELHGPFKDEGLASLYKVEAAE